MCSGGDDGGGAGDTSGPDESNAFGTDVSGGFGGFDNSNDIGDAIGAAEAAAEAAAVAQAAEDAFGGMHTNAQATGQPAASEVQAFLSNPLAPELGFLSPTPGGLAMTALGMAVPGIGLGLSALSALGRGMNALGATPGTDVDAFGSPVGEVGTQGQGGEGENEIPQQNRPAPTLATPASAQEALAPAGFVPLPAITDPIPIPSVQPPPLSPALRAMFANRMIPGA